MGAGPAEQGIPQRIARSPICSVIQQELDDFGIAIGGGAVQGSFVFGAHVAHECFGGLVRDGGAIGIGARLKEAADHKNIGWPAGLAQRAVQSGFACNGIGMAGIGTAQQKKIDNLPAPE